MAKYSRRRSGRKFSTPRSSEPLQKAQHKHAGKVHPNSAAAKVWGAKSWSFSSDELNDYDRRAIKRQADNYREEGPTR